MVFTLGVGHKKAPVPIVMCRIFISGVGKVRFGGQDEYEVNWSGANLYDLCNVFYVVAGLFSLSAPRYANIFDAIEGLAYASV